MQALRLLVFEMIPVFQLGTQVTKLLAFKGLLKTCPVNVTAERGHPPPKFCILLKSPGTRHIVNDIYKVPTRCQTLF